MTTIWKYSLRIADEQIIEMPWSAKALTVQMQNGEPALWVLVDPAHVKAPFRVRVIGTGHDIDDATIGDYVGTVQQFGGRLVWHVFFDRVQA